MLKFEMYLNDYKEHNFVHNNNLFNVRIFNYNDDIQIVWRIILDIFVAKEAIDV